jgi:radical SAM protein with 4Fe4S-binding SPASM domain
MCFQVDESFSSSKDFMGKMELDLFKKIIDETSSNGTKAITLASRGEPTLHPQLKEMLEYCSGKFIEIKMNTNATRLTKELIHTILKSGITDLVFSVDSYQKEDYEKIRVRGVFETVLNNIKLFQEIRNEFYPNSLCATRISGVKVNKDLDANEFKKFWEKYVDHVSMQEMDIRWDTYNNPLEIAAESPCNALWERMYIWFDGTCNPCDMDYKSELSVGNIKENSIKEIWNSKKYTNLRNMHMEGMRKNCYPCDRCPVGS